MCMHNRTYGFWDILILSIIIFNFEKVPLGLRKNGEILKTNIFLKYLESEYLKTHAYDCAYTYPEYSCEVS